MRRSIMLAMLGCVLGSAASGAAEFIVAGWNVESDRDTDPRLVAERMAAFPEVDVWGLSEIQNEQVATRFGDAVSRATGAPFEVAVGRTGGGDRLAVLVNTGKFEVVRTFELVGQIHAYCEATYRPRNANGRFPSFRGTLVAQLRAKDPRSPAAFFFMVNHLHRSNEAMRNCQAAFLNRWVRGEIRSNAPQSLPIIAVGDYNFDWDPPTGPGNAAFSLFTTGAAFKWVQPRELRSTQCDAAYSSILDFVFVANRAQHWVSASDIVAPVGHETREQYCLRDPHGDSDHLIVRAAFSTH
jgi:endonuclease/exonuclease/phosphatase family metal-dependent hydrolase